MAKQPKPPVRLVWSDGAMVDGSAKLSRFALPSALNRRLGVQPHKIGHRQSMLFPTRGRSNIRPASRRDSTTMLPLLDSIGELIDLPGETRERIPEGEKVLNRLHRTPLMARDELSRQVGSTRPVPKTEHTGTMRPMGRGTSPARFKKQFCARLRVARIAARYEPEQVAEILGVPVDTWRRYELRTLLPHHMIPTVSELFGVPLEFFYSQAEKERESRSA